MLTHGSHQHLWDLEQFSLPWLQWERMDPLWKSYLISDYVEATATCHECSRSKGRV